MSVGVDTVLKLARMSVSEEEKNSLAEDFRKIIEFVSKLSEIDTKDVPPYVGVSPMHLGKREDVPKGESEEVKNRIFANAPQFKKKHFVVPRVVVK